MGKGADDRGRLIRSWRHLLFAHRPTPPPGTRQKVRLLRRVFNLREHPHLDRARCRRYELKLERARLPLLVSTADITKGNVREGPLLDSCIAASSGEGVGIFYWCRGHNSDYLSGSRTAGVSRRDHAMPAKARFGHRAAPGPRLAFSAHENSRVVRLAPPQACDCSGQFDGENGQRQAHHRHCGN
jgi:hypothetical protein